MRIARSAVAAWLLLAVTACSGTASVKEAEQKVAAFHAKLDKGDYDAVWRDSSEEITRSETKEKLVGLLAAIHERFGRVKATEQNGWKVNYDNGVSTTAVTMRTTYERGVLEEDFLFRATDKGLKLAGYEFEEQ